MANKYRARNLAQMSRLRKTLRAVSPEITEDTKKLMRAAAQDMVSRMRAQAPVGKTKTLRRNLRASVSKDGLTAKAGYITRRARKAAWYAVFFEAGIRAQVKRVGFRRERRRQKLLRTIKLYGAARTQKMGFDVSEKSLARRRAYVLHIRARAARPFISGPAAAVIQSFAPKVREAVNQALGKVISHGG
ncbi:MAG: hypothetical protein DCC73_15020 [Proteobacteria bacterium]|nr:MAG: hypothetical protein DCC73_15020 [Pseudomonadota bacterium]